MSDADVRAAHAAAVDKRTAELVAVAAVIHGTTLATTRESQRTRAEHAVGIAVKLLAAARAQAEWDVGWQRPQQPK